MLRDLFEHYQQSSPIHRIDPRAKIAWVVAISLLVMLLGDPRMLGLLFLLSLGPWLAARPPLRRLKVLILLLGAALVGTMVSQAVFYYWQPRTPLITLVPPGMPVLGAVTGGVYIYREGLTYGAIQSLRFITAITTGMLIITTTHPADLLLAATRLKMPPRFAFMLTVSLRFLPLMIQETQGIMVAQQVRGVRLRGVRGTVRGFYRAFIPLLVGALRRARQLALAAQVRAYTGERTSMKELCFHTRDWVVTGAALGLLAAGVVALVCGYGAKPAGIH